MLFVFRKRNSSRSRRHFFETFVQADSIDLLDLLELRFRNANNNIILK